MPTTGPPEEANGLDPDEAEVERPGEDEGRGGEECEEEEQEFEDDPVEEPVEAPKGRQSKNTAEAKAKAKAKAKAAEKESLRKQKAAEAKAKAKLAKAKAKAKARAKAKAKAKAQASKQQARKKKEPTAGEADEQAEAEPSKPKAKAKGKRAAAAEDPPEPKAKAARKKPAAKETDPVEPSGGGGDTPDASAVLDGLRRADTQDLVPAADASKSGRETRLEYKARKQRFYRSMQSRGPQSSLYCLLRVLSFDVMTSQRQGEKTPVEIRKKYANGGGLASSIHECTNPLNPGVDAANVYEEWLASSEKWSQSKWVVELKKTCTVQRMGARRWMTRKQILERYEDEGIVEEIVNNKMQDTTTNMPHPDAPKNKAGASLTIDQMSVQLRTSGFAWCGTLRRKSTLTALS